MALRPNQRLSWQSTHQRQSLPPVKTGQEIGTGRGGPVPLEAPSLNSLAGVC